MQFAQAHFLWPILPGCHFYYCLYSPRAVLRRAPVTIFIHCQIYRHKDSSLKMQRQQRFAIF